MRTIVNKLLRWFSANARDLPWRRTLDPYAIWVSEIMLQQTQVSTVIPYWERWMRELPDIKSLARAPEQKVLKLWEGLGYYTRARNLHRAAQTLNGDPFPREYEEVLKLPGIGRYTAGAICSIAFNQPTPVLDGNVRRVLSRLFATDDGLWETANQLVAESAGPAKYVVPALAGKTPARTLMLEPPKAGTTYLMDQPASAGRDALPLSKGIKLSGTCSALNQALMELGAIICTPRQPRCAECPVAGVCKARKLSQVENFPSKPVRAAITHRRFGVFVYRHKGRYLVQQRPENVVNARLWEFPNVELTKGASDGRQGRPLCAFKHTITRYRIAVEAFLIEQVGRGVLAEPHPARGGSARTLRLARKWLPLAKLDRLPFSSAHRKILIALRTENAV